MEVMQGARVSRAIYGSWEGHESVVPCTSHGRGHDFRRCHNDSWEGTTSVVPCTAHGKGTTSVVPYTAHRRTPSGAEVCSDFTAARAAPPAPPPHPSSHPTPQNSSPT